MLIRFPRREFWEMLFEMRDRGMTILVSTAYMDEGERCEHLGIMHRSRLLGVAPPDELRVSAANLEEAIKDLIRKADRELEHGAFNL